MPIRPAVQRVFAGFVASVALAAGGRLSAQQIPTEWQTKPPGAAQAEAIMAGAERYGWPAMAGAMQAAAFDLHRRHRMDAGEGWLYAAKWAALIGENERDFVRRWISALEDARLGHGNMDTSYEPEDAPLGRRLDPRLIQELLADRAFSEAFFGLLTPHDYLPRVFDILTELYRRDPAEFRTHAQLALAIALVYDVPPPFGWPHGQVSPTALPRRLPEPAEAFRFLVETNRDGAALHKLDELGAAELKFVVDLAAPFTELEWARRTVKQPLGQLERTYSMIQYRHDRIRENRYGWTESSYELELILRTGGICVDQAYFATQAGKARGVPTLFFRGAGLDGRHAWFGYLDARGRWQLDAGRYEEQKYVAGFAHDPQTWADMTDHEVQFLSEGFRQLPPYRQSRVQALFAESLLEAGQAEDAVRAARAAVNAERRNLRGWEVLLAAQATSGGGARERETLLREAAAALQRYPELNARFMREVVASLRERGETSAADQEARMLARKFQTTRSDLSVQQAAELVARAREEGGELAAQVRVYNSALTQFGRGAGIDFFDQVVRPFVWYLKTQGAETEAINALKRARTVLEVQLGTQLHEEMRQLERRVRAE